MTRRAAVTKAELRRRLEAVQSAGLRITEIRPDGTIIIGKLPSGQVSGKVNPDDALRSWLEHAKG